MIRSRYPLLRPAGEATLDWPDATYSISIAFVGERVEVDQSISGCPQLQSCVASGKASWAVEIRSPQTLFAEVIELGSDIDSFDLDKSMIGDNLYVIPGLIGTSDIELASSGLGPVWGDGTVLVPAGTWLARGNILGTRKDRHSLLAFDIDESLSNGQMRIADPGNPDDLTFTVYLASDLFASFSDRAVQFSALVAAFARLPAVANGLEPGTGAHRQLVAVQEELRSAGVPSWEDVDDFDPLFSATAFESIKVESVMEEDE